MGHCTQTGCRQLAVGRGHRRRQAEESKIRLLLSNVILEETGKPGEASSVCGRKVGEGHPWGHHLGCLEPVMEGPPEVGSRDLAHLASLRSWSPT